MVLTVKTRIVAQCGLTGLMAFVRVEGCRVVARVDFLSMVRWMVCVVRMVRGLTDVVLMSVDSALQVFVLAG